MDLRKLLRVKPSDATAIDPPTIDVQDSVQPSGMFTGRAPKGPGLLDVAVAALATEKTLKESIPVPIDDADEWTLPASMLPRRPLTAAEKAAARKKVKAARKMARNNRRRN